MSRDWRDKEPLVELVAWWIGLPLRCVLALIALVFGFLWCLIEPEAWSKYDGVRDTVRRMITGQ